MRSRQEAQSLIEQHRVTVDGLPANKAARQVLPGAAISIASGDVAYASRGAHKLLGALAAFAGDDFPDLTGLRALDAGASTGGFTDVLLRRGVAQVIAVDVGYGQLVWELQQDHRVTVMDRTNVRHLEVADLPYRPDLIVSDLSFISLTKVIPALGQLPTTPGHMLLMVKPQFELSKAQVGNNGVVRDPELRALATTTVSQAAADLGWGTRAVAASPLPGPAGNVEYFLWLSRGGAAASADRIAEVVAQGPQ